MLLGQKGQGRVIKGCCSRASSKHIWARHAHDLVAACMCTCACTCVHACTSSSFTHPRQIRCSHHTHRSVYAPTPALRPPPAVVPAPVAPALAHHITNTTSTTAAARRTSATWISCASSYPSRATAPAQTARCAMRDATPDWYSLTAAALGGPRDHTRCWQSPAAFTARCHLRNPTAALLPHCIAVRRAPPSASTAASPPPPLPRTWAAINLSACLRPCANAIAVLYCCATVPPSARRAPPPARAPPGPPLTSAPSSACAAPASTAALACTCPRCAAQRYAATTEGVTTVAVSGSVTVANVCTTATLPRTVMRRSGPQRSTPGCPTRSQPWRASATQR